jgi:hypothetical protein
VRQRSKRRPDLYKNVPIGALVADGCNPKLVAGCVALATNDGGTVGGGNVLSATTDRSPCHAGNILETAADAGLVASGLPPTEVGSSS